MEIGRSAKVGCGLLVLSSLLLAPLGGLHTGVHAAGFQGTITVYAQGLNPSASMTKSASNPNPHNAMQLIANSWEKLHPGVHIKFVSGPGGTDYTTWLKTELVGNRAPDITWWQADPTYIDQGLIVPLDKWLTKPNPYNASAGPWGKTFGYGYYTTAYTSPGGHWGWVPLDAVSTGLLYDPAILAKAERSRVAVRAFHLGPVDGQPGQGDQGRLHRRMRHVHRGWRRLDRLGHWQGADVAGYPEVRCPAL